VPDTNFDYVGRFIYGGIRHGAGEGDLLNWMADQLRRRRVTPQASDTVKHELFVQFFGTLADDAQCEAQYTRFIASLGHKIDGPG
jgi:hypothetical protein